MVMESCIAVCKECNMPVRVYFNEHGDPVEVRGVCAHVEAMDERCRAPKTAI